MADTSSRSGVIHRRLLGVVAALALLTSVSPGAILAGPKQELQDAKDELRSIEQQIGAQRAELDRIQASLNEIATKLAEAEWAFKQTQAELREVTAAREAAEARYERLRGRLDDRARAAYMAGPAGGLEFVLGAESMADLSARVEFLDAVSKQDATLAAEVAKLAAELEIQEAEKDRALRRQAQQKQELQRRQAEISAQFGAAEAARARLDDLESRQTEIVSEKAKEYKKFQVQQRRAERAARREAARQPAAVVSNGPGPFNACPVPGGGISNSFGAPRVGHIHAGVDIFAPAGAQIVAPFAGTARSSSSGLGGLSVYVDGSEGYVYNAHLSSLGKLGNVRAGDVIGYVGTSGNAQGTSPHDHFEWHPKVIPANVPPSPYGYSVVGDAINPYPDLMEVC